MPKANGPLLSLGMSSLMIGSLHHFSWELPCTGMLFGFGFALGAQQYRPLWLWGTVLALGAPVTGLALHLLPGYTPKGTILMDVAGALVASLAALLPGMGAGCIFRRLRRLRPQPSATA